MSADIEKVIPWNLKHNNRRDSRRPDIKKRPLIATTKNLYDKIIHGFA